MAALGSRATSAGAGIDVFPEEPTTESPLFGLPGVVVTPHLGASTEEAQDRAGVVVAEQVAAALTGGVVTSAVNIPSVGARGPRGARPVPAAGPPARPAHHRPDRRRRRRCEISYEGDLANLDTRMLTSAVLAGVLHGRVEEAVNVVNAASLAAERGIEWSETATPRARDYTNRLSLRAGDVSLGGTTVGTTSRPRLVSAFGEDIDIELAPHIGIFRYLDVPGQIGRVGTILGQAQHQHRLDGRVALARRGRRGDGRDGRLAGAARRGAARSRPSTASSRSGSSPSTWSRGGPRR